MSDPELLNTIRELSGRINQLNNALMSIGTDSLQVVTAALADPAGLDDYSAHLAEMQRVRDPYPAGVADLAISFVEELEAIRYQIQQIIGQTNWYEDIPLALQLVASADVVVARIDL